MPAFTYVRHPVSSSGGGGGVAGVQKTTSRWVLLSYCLWDLVEVLCFTLGSSYGSPTSYS